MIEIFFWPISIAKFVDLEPGYDSRDFDTLSCLEMSAPYTTCDDDQTISTLICLSCNCYEKRLTLKTRQLSYIAYSDGHKMLSLSINYVLFLDSLTQIIYSASHSPKKKRLELLLNDQLQPASV